MTEIYTLRGMKLNPPNIRTYSNRTATIDGKKADIWLTLIAFGEAKNIKDESNAVIFKSMHSRLQEKKTKCLTSAESQMCHYYLFGNLGSPIFQLIKYE